MRPARLLLPLLAALALPALAADGDGDVVATLGGEPITLEQIDQAGDAQLMLLKDNLYWARERAFDRLVDRRVREMEAKELGMSVSSFLEQEVVSKVPEPTEEQIQAFWNANPSIDPARRPEMREDVVGYLKSQAAAPIREALMERLRAKHASNLKANLPTARKQLDLVGRPAKGAANAPVVLAAFTDYQCAGCASLVEAIDAIKDNFGQNLRVVHVDFPNVHHDRAFEAAVAARCAGRFGKYWEYHDELFLDTKDLSDERLLDIATRLDLDLDGFRDCLGSKDAGAEVDADKALGESVGVEGTPHVFVNGLGLRGGFDANMLAQVIAMELDRLRVPAPGR